jgi:hypothetical protein
MTRGNLIVHALMRLVIYGVLSVLHRRRDDRVREYTALVRAALSPRLPR